MLKLFLADCGKNLCYYFKLPAHHMALCEHLGVPYFAQGSHSSEYQAQCLNLEPSTSQPSSLQILAPTITIPGGCDTDKTAACDSPSLPTEKCWFTCSSSLIRFELPLSDMS